MSMRVLAPAIVLAAAFSLTGPVLTNSARAADPIAGGAFTPAAPVIYDWSGPYVGLSAGATWDTFSTALGVVGARSDFDASGFAGGAFGGINFQNQNIVYGVEADINFSTAEETKLIAGVPVTADNDWFSTLRGRIGYAADRVMIYGTGGVAVGDVSVSAGGFSQSDTRVGWTVGAGLEAALTDNITLRGEYLYTDYGKTSGNLGATPFASEFDSHTVRAGVTYQFR